MPEGSRVVVGAGDGTGAAVASVVAAEYVLLRHQPRCAWTHELDLRPYTEK